MYGTSGPPRLKPRLHSPLDPRNLHGHCTGVEAGPLSRAILGVAGVSTNWTASLHTV